MREIEDYAKLKDLWGEGHIQCEIGILCEKWKDHKKTVSNLYITV